MPIILVPAAHIAVRNGASAVQVMPVSSCSFMMCICTMLLSTDLSHLLSSTRRVYLLYYKKTVELVVKTVRVMEEALEQAITTTVEFLGRMQTHSAAHPATMGLHVPLARYAMQMPPTVPWPLTARRLHQHRPHHHLRKIP